MEVSERRALLPVLLAPAVVVAAVFTAIRPTNFGGHDEWLVLSLASRGIIGFPYASRPLALLWSVPGAFAFPNDVIGQLVMHGAYLAMTGALVAWLALRRLDLPPAAALLGGVLAAMWAPLDNMRLDVVLLTRYSGCLAGSVAAMALFLDGWRRGRSILGVLGAILAAAMVLVLEGALPLLAGAPLLALAARPQALHGGAERRSLLRWTIQWELALVIAALPILLSLTGRGPDGYQYQSAIGIDVHPVSLASSLLRQYGYQLLPIITTPLSEIATPKAALAAVLFALCFLAATRGSAPHDHARPALLRAMLLGVALAALGWIGLVVSPLVRTPARAQFLSAPGVALLLAGALGLLASRLPPRAWRIALLVVGAWIVAVGAGRTAAMQRDWDRTSFWPAQRGSLSQLTTQVPGLAPNTMVVLVDGTRAWPVTFGFRHALHLLYGEAVAGYVWKGHEFLYPARFTPDGIVSEPAPAIRKAWNSPATLHRYDEVVAVRLGADGSLVLLDEWPPDLPPLPAGATYAPRARILSADRPPSWRVLDRER